MSGADLAADIRLWIGQAAAGASPKLHASAAYSGSSRRTYGLSLPALQDYVKTLVAQQASLPFETWLGLLDDLYHGETLEERIIAGMLLDRYPRHRAVLPLSALDHWLRQLVGWMEVDTTCQSTFRARDLAARWEEWQSFLRALARDANVNKRRASLVLLLRALRESDDPRFLALGLEQVDQLKAEKNKLIVKAISWLLREAAKHHHEAVTAYLNTHEAELPRTSVSETRRKLETGKKNPRRPA